MVEVETVGERVCCRIALGEGRQTEGTLDQRQHRGVVIVGVADVSWLRVGRYHRARHPKSVAGRGRDVVVEAAALVVVQDRRALSPAGPGGYRVNSEIRDSLLALWRRGRVLSVWFLMDAHRNCRQ